MPCQNTGCNKRALYGSPDDRKPLFCSEHKPATYIHVFHKYCEVSGCTTRASYGDADSKTKKYCATHKALGMIVVNAHYCQHNECNKVATFKVDATDTWFCASHKPDWVMSTDKRCQHEGCTVQPSFGYQSNKPTHCKMHKEPDMMNVKGLKCTISGCNKHATYGNKKTNKKERCAEHANNTMINLCTDVCQTEGCNKFATFGLIVNKPVSCNEHKTPEMSNVKAQECLEMGCERYATWGIIKSKPTHCQTHASESMIPKYKICKHADCKISVTPEYDYCAHHDDENKRRVRVREAQVASFLQQAQMNWTSWNNEIQNGRECGGAYRPDFVFETQTHVVILEVDEHQHAQKGYSCDNRRMVDIFNAYGGTPVYFIRFNPDSYRIGGNRRNRRTDRRLDLLLETLKFGLNNLPLHPLLITRLYYDHQTSLRSHSEVDISRGEFEEKEISDISNSFE